MRRPGWNKFDVIPETKKKRGRRSSRHTPLDPHRQAHQRQSALIEGRIEDALLDRQCGEVWECE